MKVPRGSTPDPARQFTKQDDANPAKDDHRPGLPHQSVNQLVQLRIGHTPHLQRISRQSAFAQFDRLACLRWRECGHVSSRNTVEERK
jgi:hypothetical protein